MRGGLVSPAPGVPNTIAKFTTQVESDGSGNAFYAPNGTTLTKYLAYAVGSQLGISAAGNQVSSAQGTAVSFTTTGNITLTSTPSITAGATGQLLILINTGSFNLVLQDNGTLAGSTVLLGSIGTSVTIAPKGTATFIFAGSSWYCLGHT